MKKVIILTVLVVLGIPLVAPRTASAANERDVDYDWIMATIDVLVSELVPGFSYPLGGIDNDSNGMWEEDTLAMLSSCLRGGVRVSGIGDTPQMRSDFATNRNAADWDMELTDTGFMGNCWALINFMGVSDCRLTTILKSDLADLGPAGVMLSDILLDFVGGLATCGDNPATFNFFNNFMDALVQAILDSGMLDQSIIDLMDVNRLRSDLHIQPGNYLRWGASPSPAPRRNAYGAQGNLDLDGSTNISEYAAAGGDREIFLATNTITPPIHITDHPAGGSFLSGATHLLDVTFAGGEAPFTFMWEDAQDFPGDDATYGLVTITDGNGISGSTTEDLSFDYLLPAHNEMAAWVRISDLVTVHNPVTPPGNPPPGAIESDAFGGRTSAPAVVYVTLRAFAITPQPVGGTVDEGAPFSMNSGAVGGASVPSYQWYHNGSPVSGATNKILAFPSIQMSDAGPYFFRATNADKAFVDSNIVTVVVQEALSITTHPVGGNKRVGDSHTFTVGISGGVGPFAYQWYRGPLGAPPGTGSPVGPNSSTYNLPSLVAGDQGSYSCIVTDTGTSGSVTSNGANLTVLAIQTQPSSLEVAAGSPAQFSVVVVPGSGLPGSPPNEYTYQWRKGGSNISGATQSTYTIPMVAPADAGDYDCIVGDSAPVYLTSAAATLTVTVTPITFPVQPQGGAKYTNDSHTFTVTATGGVGALTYQWQKDGGDIPSATDANLVLNPLQLSDEADYRCLVGDDLRPPDPYAVSNTVTLQVRDRLSLPGQPGGANKAAGDSHTFSVTVAGGYQPLSYQWYRGILGSPPGAGTPVYDLGDTYEITNLGATHQGTYSCVVTDSNPLAAPDTATSNGADLTVLVIQYQPQSLEVGDGASATFDIIVLTGSGLPGVPPNQYTYQWRYKGVDIPGATDALYQIPSCENGSPDGNPPPVNPNGDEGDYTCLVGDSAPVFLESDPATLTVTAAPITFVVQPVGANKYVGDGHTFSCEVAGGTPGPPDPVFTYQWTKDAVNIPLATDAEYTMSNLVLGDAADYRCLVGEIGVRPPDPYAQSAIAALDVRGPVTFTTQPTGANKVAGDSHTFGVVATGGYQPLMYEWYRGPLGSPPGAGSVVYDLGATFELTGLDADDQGAYSCVVTDDNATDFDSNSVDLTVLAIQVQPTSQEVGAGNPVTFDLVVEPGSGLVGPPPNEYTYQWRYKGADLPGGTESSYTIPACQDGSPDGDPLPVNPTGDEGEYTCVVGDSAPVTLQSDPAVLTVTANPITFTEQPQGGSKYEGQQHTFSITVTGGSGAVKTYQWQKDGGDIAGATDPTFNLTNLELVDAGEYKCVVGEVGVRPPEPYAESATAVLLVGTPLVIETQPEDADLYANDTFTAEVGVSGGVGAIQFQWYKGPAPVPDATTATYEIASVQPSDGAAYRCFIWDDVGVPIASDFAYLEVASEIQISQHPESAEVERDDYHELTIQASGGKRTLHYAWTKDGEPVGIDYPVYAIPSMTLEDGGWYRCEVSDSGTPPGSVLSNMAILTVLVTFGIDQHPEGDDIYTDDTYTLDVVGMFAMGTMSYQWYFDSEAKAPVAIADATNDSYTIVSATPADAGGYYCEVTDDVGTPGEPGDDVTLVSDTAMVGVEDHIAITTPPYGGHKYVGNPHTFAVVAEGGYPPLQYQWKKDGGEIADATGTSYTIDELALGDAGTYTVVLSDSNEDIVESGGAVLLVTELGLPVAGLAGLGVLVGALVLVGASIVRRKRACKK